MNMQVLTYPRSVESGAVRRPVPDQPHFLAPDGPIFRKIVNVSVTICIGAGRQVDRNV